MNDRFKDKLLVILKHPWVLPGFLLIGITEALSKIGTKQRVKKRDEKFIAEVKAHLPFLFAEYGARSVPNDRETPP